MSTIDQKQDTEEGRKKSHLMCQSYEDKVVVSNLSHTWFLEREREKWQKLAIWYQQETSAQFPVSIQLRQIPSSFSAESEPLQKEMTSHWYCGPHLGVDFNFSLNALSAIC